MLNEILVGAIILVVIRALALPLGLSIARLWMLIYTVGVPSNLREDRRAEILSDLHEHVTDFQEQGYRPDEIAIRIVLRVVQGMKDGRGVVLRHISRGHWPSNSQWEVRL